MFKYETGAMQAEDETSSVLSVELLQQLEEADKKIRQVEISFQAFKVKF